MYSYDKRPLTKNSQRISASVFVRNFYLELKLKSDLANVESVRELISKIEGLAAVNLRQETNGKVEFTKENKVRLTYTKSNLGKGYIFWFLCSICGRRVRYLYIPPNSQVTACRICHRLAYDQQNDNKRFRSLKQYFR